MLICIYMNGKAECLKAFKTHELFYRSGVIFVMADSFALLPKWDRKLPFWRDFNTLCLSPYTTKIAFYCIGTKRRFFYSELC